MPASTTRTEERPAILSARLLGHVAIEARAGGEIVAWVQDHAVGLGAFGADVIDRAQTLRTGLPFGAFAADAGEVERGLHLLVRRLARRGLVEYRLGRPDAAEVVIEPQLPGYWPAMPEIGEDDVLVLSRFAYLRRRANDMVLESPRAGALFALRNPAVAATLSTLATPQPVKRLREEPGFPGTGLLALLVDSRILFTAPAADDAATRAAEGDDHLVLWDFHDFLFHTRSTEGRHANPLGGNYRHANVLPPLPALRPPWPGAAIDLRAVTPGSEEPLSPAARLLRARHSTRDFDDRDPITLVELARFLDRTARVHGTWSSPLDTGEDDAPVVDYTVRPYPSAGASYELEIYLAVDRCEGLARGYYHYDPGEHALRTIEVRPEDLRALFTAAEYAMGVPAPPQILVTIAARFGRVSWKYSSVAYELILKNVGALTQTLYLMAEDMGLGGCAIGSAHIELFARMTGLAFHVEGAVGQFAMGRALNPGERTPSDGPA